MTAKQKRQVKCWAAVLLVVIAGGLLLVNYVFIPLSAEPFESFRNAVKQDPNFDNVIMWAREYLRDTNNQSGSFELRSELQLEAKYIGKDKLPKQLTLIGKNLFGENLVSENATLYRELAQPQTFVAINYSLGRAASYGITVGPTNFTMQPAWVTRFEKCNDGVFIYEVKTGL
jgi:hypothetical protein